MKKYTARLLKCMTALTLALLLSAAPITASAVSAWINSSSAKIYAMNGDSGKLPRGTSVDLTDVSGSWAKIKYKGVTGITKLKYVTLKSGMTGYAKNDAPLYKSASTSSGKKGTIPKGTKLKVVGIDGSFYQVTDTSYSVGGYVKSGNVSKSKPSTSSSSSKKSYTKGERVAIVAKAQLGKSYSYGAEGSSRYDCSGLAYYVYRVAVDTYLKRSSIDQATDSRFSTIRSLSSLKLGDLLCFNTGGTIDHVGVYIGGGSFIHASQSAGKVIKSSLSESYYQDAFLWAKRII